MNSFSIFPWVLNTTYLFTVKLNIPATSLAPAIANTRLFEKNITIENTIKSINEVSIEFIEL